MAACLPAAAARLDGSADIATGKLSSSRGAAPFFLSARPLVGADDTSAPPWPVPARRGRAGLCLYAAAARGREDGRENEVSDLGRVFAVVGERGKDGPC